MIEAEVVLISKKSKDEDVRWVYLDIGKFGGLIATLDESIKYRIQVPDRNGPSAPVILAGPTCDSADILYEKTKYRLPLSLKVGDKVRILATGAYTTSYAAVNFNGFQPLESSTSDRSLTRRINAGRGLRGGTSCRCLSKNPYDFSRILRGTPLATNIGTRDRGTMSGIYGARG